MIGCHTWGRCAIALCAAGYGALQVLGRRAGSTRQERREALAGDGTVPHPHLVTDHAVTIGAPPEAVWQWLTQMGWHRGGYYAPRWVDRLLFPANLPSADVLDSALLRDLAAGDTIPDGPPGTAWFVVEQASAPGTLVLHSTTHVPAPWRDRFGAAVDWTWSFRLTGLPGDRTRLHIRMRGRAAPCHRIVQCASATDGAALATSDPSFGCIMLDWNIGCTDGKRPAEAVLAAIRYHSARVPVFLLVQGEDLDGIPLRWRRRCRSMCWCWKTRRALWPGGSTTHGAAIPRTCSRRSSVS